MEKKSYKIEGKDIPVKRTFPKLIENIPKPLKYSENSLYFGCVQKFREYVVFERRYFQCLWKETILLPTEILYEC
jgi:hypothetical protein